MSAHEETSAAEEVHRLRIELEKSKEKLQTWKTQAKEGVEQLRARILQLTEALDASETQRRELAARCAGGDGETRATHSLTATVPPGTSLEAAWTYLDETALLLSAACERKALWTMKALVELRPVLGPGMTAEDVETLKRRTATTLKLQSKNLETQQRRVDDLQRELRQTQAAVRERDAVVASRDEALRVVERRLEAAMQAKRQMEAEQEALQRGASMERLHELEERLHHEMERARGEFEARERALVLQHQEELHRAARAHEEEVEAWRRDLEDRDTQAHLQGLVESPSPPTAPPVDHAYTALLGEYEALLETYHAAVAEKTLAVEALRQTAAPAKAAPGEAGKEAPPATAEPTSLAEARAVIATLRAHLRSTTEDVWAAKRALMDEQSRTQDASGGDGLAAQKVVYLQSVVVKLLHERHNDGVVAHLVPVLGMLLRLNPADLTGVPGVAAWRSRDEASEAVPSAAPLLARLVPPHDDHEGKEEKGGWW